MNFVRSYALLSILLASATAPINGAEFYDDRKVSHIEVVYDSDEATNFDPTAVLSRLKTQEGTDFSQLTFDIDLKTLADEYDRVEPSIQMKNGQLFITIHIIPKPVIHQILWNGNIQYKTSTLQNELDIKPNTVFNRQQFNKSFNKVKEYYFKKGYFESQLSYYTQPVPGSNEVDIIIDVKEGRPGHIKKVVLNGFIEIIS